MNPPTAAHVEAVYRSLVPAYRLPLLWLDWSGARVASVDTLRVGDYDERDRRIRLQGVDDEDTAGAGVEVPDVLADALEASLGPREDRDADARLFPGVSAARLRTAIARACKASGVPVFSPHDLRHRRICAAAPSGPLVGGDRPVRRAAEAQHHRGHVHTRLPSGFPLRQAGQACQRCPECSSGVHSVLTNRRPGSPTAP